MRYLVLLVIALVCGTCAPAKKANIDVQVQDGISDFVEKKD